MDLGISEDLIQQLSKQQRWRKKIEGKGLSKRFSWRLEDPRMSEDQLNNNLDLVSGRESLELIKTVGTGEFLGQEKKLVSRGSKKNNKIKMLICLEHTHQHKARVVTRSFDVCLNSNIDDTNTMAMEGNKDVVFPRTSVMNNECTSGLFNRLQSQVANSNLR